MVEAERKIMILHRILRESDAAPLHNYEHSAARNGLDHVEGVGEKDLVELEGLLFTLNVLEAVGAARYAAVEATREAEAIDFRLKEVLYVCGVGHLLVLPEDDGEDD